MEFQCRYNAKKRIGKSRTAATRLFLSQSCLVSRPLIRCFFLVCLALLPDRIDLGWLSDLLAAQLATFRSLLSEGFLTRLLPSTESFTNFYLYMAILGGVGQ